MKYFSLVLIVILSQVYLHNLAEGISYVEPKCNHTDHNASLFDNATLTKIDDLLDELYTTIVTNVAYEADCTFAVHFPTEKDTIEFSVLLEGLEVRRNRYKEGLWGYCGKEGANALKEDLNNLINMAKAAVTNNQKFGICDRDELLYCHPKHRKCQCLVDNKNFRNYASEWWEDEGEKDEGHIHVGKDFCGLIIGSDCPSGTDSKFKCLPGTTCRLKSNTSVICSPPLKGIEHFRRLGDDNDNFVDTDTDSTPPAQVTMEKVRQKREAVGRTNGKFRFIRRDMGNVNCQCYGYTGGNTGGSLHTNQLIDKIIFKKIISQGLFFGMFYIFNLL